MQDDTQDLFEWRSDNRFEMDEWTLNFENIYNWFVMKSQSKLITFWRCLEHSRKLTENVPQVYGKLTENLRKLLPNRGGSGLS